MPKCVKSLAVFRDSYFSPYSFYVNNAKIDFFGEKMILSAFLIDLKCMWSSRLGKTPNTCIFRMVDLLHIFKITYLLDFWKIFENHQKHMLKWLNA